jgi:hypothetical protein
MNIYIDMANWVNAIFSIAMQYTTGSANFKD